MIQQFTIDDGQSELELSGLARGTYLIACIQGDGRVVKRVVVQ